MKKLVLIVATFLAIYSNITNAQAPFLIGSAGAEYGKANTIDREGNHIVTALFANSVNVNPTGSTILSTNGMIDVLIAKYDTQGRLVWGKRFGGTTTTDAPHAIETDAQNNIVVGGYCGNPNLQNATVNFNPSGTSTQQTYGGYDGFVAKYTAEGNYLWSFILGRVGSTAEERIWDIAIDRAGDIYVTGAFTGSVNFNPLGSSPNNKQVNTGVGLFLSKYNSNGVNLWTEVYETEDTSVFFEAYTAVDTDSNDNVFFAGNFRSKGLNIGGSPSVNLSAVGQTDMFLLKYSSMGVLQWGKSFGSAQQDIVSPGALRIDRSGNAYFTGRISGAVNFATNSTPTLVSGASLFVTGFDTNGNLIRAWGMTSNAGDGGHRIGFDDQNNLYVAGWINGTVDFDPTAGTFSVIAVAPTADAFAAKYNSSGSIQWVSTLGASNSSENNIAAGLAVSDAGEVYITGQLFGTNADADPTSSTLLLSAQGLNDCFVIRYNTNGSITQPTAVGDFNTVISDFTLFQNYPNPFNPVTTISFSLPVAENVTIKLFDVLGSEVKTLIRERMEAGSHTIQFNAEGLPSGVYIYKMEAGNFVTSKKLTLLK